MRVAICADKDDVNGLVPKTFAAAEFMMIINGDTNVMEKVFVREDERNIGFAEHVVEEDCEVLICGAMDREAFEIVAGAGVTRFDGSTKKVQRAYDYMKRGKLTNIRDYVGGPGSGHTHDYSCECGENEEEEQETVPVFDAVISAAGLSSRMGDYKPLMTLGGVKNAHRVIRSYLESGVRRVILVAGYRRDELEAAVRECFDGEQVIITENPEYETTGMLESARIGLKVAVETGEPADGIFFGPVDVPLFSAFTLDTLKDRFTLGTEDIFLPSYCGKGGHPLLIRTGAVPVLMEGDESMGLKSVLAQEKLATVRVDVPDRGCVMDADTPEEYALLEKELEQRLAPDDDRCRILWDWAGVLPECQEHCRKVTEVADEISAACVQAGNGAELHPERIHAAAMLHDILKGMDRHEQHGQEFLKDLGMAEVGALVGTHGNLPEEMQSQISDALIVCLADKLVSGAERVSLQERFDRKRKQFTGNKLALAGLEKRYASAVRMWETALAAGWDDCII